jgi:hypothetical protein
VKIKMLTMIDYKEILRKYKLHCRFVGDSKSKQNKGERIQRQRELSRLHLFLSSSPEDGINPCI